MPTGYGRPGRLSARSIGAGVRFRLDVKRVEDSFDVGGVRAGIVKEKVQIRYYPRLLPDALPQVAPDERLVFGNEREEALRIRRQQGAQVNAGLRQIRRHSDRLDRYHPPGGQQVGDIAQEELRKLFLDQSRNFFLTRAFR